MWWYVKEHFTLWHQRLKRRVTAQQVSFLIFLYGNIRHHQTSVSNGFLYATIISIIIYIEKQLHVPQGSPCFRLISYWLLSTVSHFFPFLPTGRLPSHLRELPADHWMLNEFLPGGGIYGIWMACDHFHGENDQTGEGALRMVLKAVLWQQRFWRKNMLHEQTLLWQRKREGNVKRLWVVELVLSCCHVQSNISTSRPGPKVDRLFANSHELSENATIHTALWHVLGLRSCPATRLNKRSQSWVSSAFLPSIPCSLKAKWFLLVRSCASTQLHFWRFLRNVHLAQTKKRISSNIIEHP